MSSHWTTKDARKLLKEKQRRGLETCTLERLMHCDGEVIFDQNTQIVNQAMVDSMNYKKLISKRQFEAADRFRHMAYEAGVIWSGTSLRDPGTRTRADDRLPAFAASGRSRAFTLWAAAARVLDRDEASLLAAVIWPRDGGIHAASLMGHAAERMIPVSSVRAILDKLANHFRLP